MCTITCIIFKSNIIPSRVFPQLSFEGGHNDPLHMNKLFPKRQILDPSKLKEFADDNFKFVENDRKYSKRVENTVGKGELLVTSNFSFSHRVFKRLVLQTGKSQGLFGKGLKKVNNKFLGSSRKIWESKPSKFKETRGSWKTLPSRHSEYILIHV